MRVLLQERFALIYHCYTVQNCTFHLSSIFSVQMFSWLEWVIMEDRPFAYVEDKQTDQKIQQHQWRRQTD